MHVSRSLNVAQDSLQSSRVALGRRGTRHCQRFCRVMQVEKRCLLKYIKMPTTDRYVSSSDPSSTSSSPFAADSFSIVLVVLQPSMPSMFSTYASLLLRVTLYFVMWSPWNGPDLPFSMYSARLSFNVFSSCAKKLSRCFRFPTLKRSSTCTTTISSLWPWLPSSRSNPVQTPSVRSQSSASLSRSDFATPVARACRHTGISSLSKQYLASGTQLAVSHRMVSSTAHDEKLQKCHPRPFPRPAPIPTL